MIPTMLCENAYLPEFGRFDNESMVELNVGIVFKSDSNRAIRGKIRGTQRLISTIAFRNQIGLQLILPTLRQIFMTHPLIPV